MTKTYNLELNIFDMNYDDCKNNIDLFINKININDEDIVFKLLKNNTNSFQNMINIPNVMYFSNKISKYKNKIKKIIIITNNKDDTLLQNAITTINNILPYDITEVLEFKNF